MTGSSETSSFTLTGGTTAGDLDEELEAAGRYADALTFSETCRALEDFEPGVVGDFAVDDVESKFVDFFTNTTWLPSFIF